MESNVRNVKEEAYIKTLQKVLIIASAVLIAGLTAAWIVSGPGQEWRQYQRNFRAHWSALPDSARQSGNMVPVKGIQQLELEGLDRIDRCVTCHAGMDDPFMKEAGIPYGAHPGTYLTDHSTEKYGCTVCHGGQGRALNSIEAHALEPGIHWDQPLLTQPFIQSSCGQCHLAIFSEQRPFEGTEVFREGHAIFAREGCLGCHKARGVGGILGPDLTEQGEKTRSEYNFENIDTDQSVSNWLKEHFRDPEMVSPGSRMLEYELPETDLDALTTFVLGLKKPDIDFQYFSLEALNEFKGNRPELVQEKLFSMVCSGCHGKKGEGKSYVTYQTGVPAILGEDFNRVVSEDYLIFTLRKGRSGRQMASWVPEISGLEDTELLALVSYIKAKGTKQEVAFDPGYIRQADSGMGALLYAQHCSTCHGEEASGGVALALNRKDLLRNASDGYLFRTLVTGRENACMPSWKHLPDADLYAMVKYLRSFQVYAPLTPGIAFRGNDADDGKLKYHFMCSRCHGEAGQGQTGPAIMNRGFLSAATDAFLYNTISSGREHTAMFGWSKDVYNQERLNREDIGNIIAYLRDAASKEPEYIYAGANPGDRSSGEKVFRMYCRECHGDNGEGVKAPALNNQELLNAASNGHIMATITIGRSGTDMPAWGREEKDHPALSASERRDVVAFIRSWERIRIHY